MSGQTLDLGGAGSVARWGVEVAKVTVVGVVLVVSLEAGSASTSTSGGASRVSAIELSSTDIARDRVVAALRSAPGIPATGGCLQRAAELIVELGFAAVAVARLEADPEGGVVLYAFNGALTRHARVAVHNDGTTSVTLRDRGARTTVQSEYSVDSPSAVRAFLV